MNQQNILQSNLLDIIFENRNKEYGAYKLRKSYQSRLSLAVFSAVGFALAVSLFVLFENSSAVLTPVHPVTLLPGLKISRIYRLPRQTDKKMPVRHVAVKNILKTIPGADRPPLIVASANINSLPATLVEIHPSFTGVSAMNMAPGDDVTGDGARDKTTSTIEMKLPGPGKPVPGGSC